MTMEQTFKVPCLATAKALGPECQQVGPARAPRYGICPWDPARRDTGTRNWVCRTPRPGVCVPPSGRASRWGCATEGDGCASLEDTAFTEKLKSENEALSHLMRPLSVPTTRSRAGLPASPALAPLKIGLHKSHSNCLHRALLQGAEFLLKTFPWLQQH